MALEAPGRPVGWQDGRRSTMAVRVRRAADHAEAALRGAMTISIRVEPGTGTAIANCSGVLRRSDAETGAAALWGTPGWPGRSAVWDFRDARFDLSTGDIHEIARFILHHQPATPPSRVAFVTARDVDFGMARMFEAFRDDPRTEFRVFRSYEDAVQWAASPGPAGPSQG